MKFVFTTLIVAASAVKLQQVPSESVAPALVEEGPPSVSEIAGYIMKEFDKNGDGKISKKEFTDAIKKEAKDH